MSKLPQKIAVIGLGLIGGSIFMGLKKRSTYESEIIGVKKGDKLPDDVDFVIIATPILEILNILNMLDKKLMKTTLVIDVGSTKEIICKHASLLKNKNLIFVGTHPMAGREVSGFSNSDPNLFVNKTWIICKSQKQVLDMVKILGAIPIIMDPAKHDELIASASALPLLTGSLLVNTVFSQNDQTAVARLASTGFRDTTRLASFSPKIKAEIVSTNKNNILDALDNLEKEIRIIKNMIRKDETEKLENYFIKAKEARDSWMVNYFS